MVLKKQYLRYEKSGTNFGLVASPQVTIKFVKLNNQLDKYVAVAAGENVIIYDTKTQIKEKILESDQLAHVSTFEVIFVDQPLMAVGYEDGRIKVFNYESGELKCSFVGHKSAISSLSFDVDGMRLASGGKDTDLAVWDLVSESGLFRLRGHKQKITKCCFMKTHPNILVSSSQDALIKFWDLTTQHCFKTLFGHKSEIWSFALIKEDRRLITGSNDLKVFKISFKDEPDDDNIAEINEDNQLIDDDAENNEIMEEEEKSNPIKVRFVGAILRASTTRLVDLQVDRKERLMMCNGNDAFVECFKLRNDEEIKSHLQKKLRKLKRKINDDDDSHYNDVEQLSFKDEFQRQDLIKTNSNVKAISISQPKVAFLMGNNNFELFSFSEKQQSNQICSFDQFGHRTPVNSLSISEDNYFLLSASRESVKLWNRVTKKCINTIQLREPITCCTLVPGNRFCVVGTRKGNLIVLNLGSAAIVDSYRISEQQITCLYAYPNGKGLVSGSDDKKIKFWNYELENRNLVLDFDRELELEEAVTCLAISANMKLLSIALLDSTVKIYYLDSLKFFLSLYGHKFPVQCMDISSDCTLIATGSKDKNVKIWGLDFGDCHKSIFSHDDVITSLKFVNQTHYYFTSSLDKTIKEWDADTFDKILTLRGHESEVRSLLVTSNAKYVISAGQDLSMRAWERSDEILIADDELDTERELEHAKEEFQNDETVIAGEQTLNQETGLATRKNFETLHATERLIEAIDLYHSELAKRADYDKMCEQADKDGKERPPEMQPNILFMVYNTKDPQRYVLEVIKSIRSSEVEECLICLPFDYVSQLLVIISELLDNNWEVELLCRFSVFLVRIHFGQVVANSKLAPVIKRLRMQSASKVKQLRETSGINLAGLEYFNNQLSSKDEITLFTQAHADLNEKKKKRNKKQAEKESVYLIGL